MKFTEYRRLKESGAPEEKLEEDGADGIGAPTNNTDSQNFATYATPIFTEKRFGRMKEFVIPRDQYAKMRHGRTLGDRWINYVEDPDLQAAVRKSYHEDKELLLTCAETGVSSIIRKEMIANKMNRRLNAGTTDGVL